MRYEPLVSIVIPVYNGANYLKEAIEAALAQTYKNIEILVVNDGSSDDGESAKIALSYGDKIRYFEKPNGGVSTALNLAVENMKGQWFSWLSHDDLYLPDKILRQIEFLNKLLAKYQDLDLDRTVVYCKNYTIDKSGRIIKRKIFMLPEHMDRQHMILAHLKNYRIGGCAVLIPVKAFSEAGQFDVDCRTASDKEYWFRLINRGYDFYFLNKRLVKNRVHKKQVGKVYADRMRSEGDALNTQIVKTVWENRTDETWHYFLKIACYLEKREHKNASKYALECAKTLSDNKLAFRVGKAVGIRFYQLRGKLFFALRSLYRKVSVR